MTTNDPFFNGWDADILIHDIKLAILWCGDWHYIEMFGNHSLKQVENRDNYKTKQILKKGRSVCFIREYTTIHPNVERSFNSLLNIIKDIDNVAFTLYLPKIKK